MRIESTSEVLLVKTSDGFYISKEGGWHLDRDINKAVRDHTEKQVKQTISTYRVFTSDKKSKFDVELNYYRISSTDSRTGFVEAECYNNGNIKVYDNGIEVL